MTNTKTIVLSYDFFRYETKCFLDPFCTPFGDVCMTQLKYYILSGVHELMSLEINIT